MIRPAIVLAAPHRLAFLAGSLSLGGLAAWWLCQLTMLHFGFPAIAVTTVPPVLLHGPTMIYSGFTPFTMGFLLTVFPRWMGQPDIGISGYAPVSIPLFAGVVATQAGLWSGYDNLVTCGLAIIAVGWLVALGVLGSVLLRNRQMGRPPSWHGLSAWSALLLGFVGLLCAISFLFDGNVAALTFANRIGIGGFLIPLFLTVAHRMIPFFAGNVVSGYVLWRPNWLLAVLWLLLLARLWAELAGQDALSLASNVGLTLVTGLMSWKWWPRAAAPGVLKVLIWGFAWAPVGFALRVVDLAIAPVGRAPDHALMIGFSGSLLVAMVTRVTRGHSGRPLAMSAAAWIAFAGIQLAAITRIAAALRWENGALLVLAAVIFAASLIPWAARNSQIYLSPRSDGKAG